MEKNIFVYQKPNEGEIKREQTLKCKHQTNLEKKIRRLRFWCFRCDESIKAEFHDPIKNVV